MITLKPKKTISHLTNNNIYPKKTKSIYNNHRIISIFIPINLNPKITIFIHNYINKTTINNNFNTFIQLKFSKNLIKYNIFIT